MDYFSTLTQQDWLILGGAVLLGIIVGWLIGYLPGRGARKQLETRIAELETKLKSTSQNLADTQAQAQSLQSSVTSSGADLVDAQNKLSTVQADFQSLQDEKNSLDTEVANLNQEVGDLSTRLVQSQDELNKMTVNVEAMTQNLTAKDTALNEAYRNIVLLQGQMQERDKMIIAATSELQSTKTNLATMTTVKDELESRLHRARGDVAGEMALVTSTMIKLKEDALNQANARIALLTQELEALRGKARG
jgi:uncharacterized protein (DUF3084 family)